MSELAGRLEVRIVGILVLLEAVSVYILWTLDPLTQEGQGIFEIYVAVDLVAFAMISYMHRTNKSGDDFNRGAVIAGCLFIFVLLISSLLI